MAVPAQSPLQHYLAVQRPLDAQMRRLLREASQEAERIVLAHGSKDTFEKTRMRQAVRDLQKMSLDTWGEVEGVTQEGVKRAARAAATSERWMQGVLKDHFGADIPDWDKALGYSAENGITAVLAKQKNAIPLSRRIYQARAFNDDALDQILRRDLLLQKSAAQIAKDARGFFHPDVPGGVSYAANRLARTEINNAFHTQQITSREDEPWTEAIHWNLSGSHPRPDKCNEYAEKEHQKGGGVGNFRPGDVPGKPHPNCLCYLTTITIGEEEFVASFLAGKYDDYMDHRLGELPGPPSAGGTTVELIRQEKKEILPSKTAQDFQKSAQIYADSKVKMNTLVGKKWDGYQLDRGPEGYVVQNKILRGEDNSARRKLVKVWEDIFSQLGQTTEEPTRFFRGIKGQFATDLISNAKAGTILADAGVTSTTASTNAARGWLTDFRRDDVAPDDSVMLEIRVPIGTRLVGGHEGTFETMMKPGTKIKIISVDKRDSPEIYKGEVNYIIAEVVP